MVHQPICHTMVWGLGPGTAAPRRSSSRGARGNTSRCHLDIWTQDTGNYQLRRRYGYVTSHRCWPLSNTTLLCYQMQALWTRRTHGEASLFYVISMVTLLIKGKTCNVLVYRREAATSPVPLDRRKRRTQEACGGVSSETGSFASRFP